MQRHQDVTLDYHRYFVIAVLYGRSDMDNQAFFSGARVVWEAGGDEFFGSIVHDRWAAKGYLINSDFGSGGGTRIDTTSMVVEDG